MPHTWNTRAASNSSIRPIQNKGDLPCFRLVFQAGVVFLQQFYCWEGDHKLYAAGALVLLNFYVVTSSSFGVFFLEDLSGQSTWELFLF